MYITQIWTL